MFFRLVEGVRQKKIIFLILKTHMTLSTLLIVAECRTRVTYELSDDLALRRFSLSRGRDNKNKRLSLISFPSSYYIYVMSFVLRKIVHAINKLSSNRIKS